MDKRDYKQPRVGVDVIVLKGNKILLHKRKNVGGSGTWAFPGGHLEFNEDIKDCAKREVMEEAGVTVERLEKRGVLEFEFEGNPEIMEVHIFGTSDFAGEPKESDEMAPQWFSANELPFDKMWPDDRHWMPFFLAGKKFAGKFLFQGTDKIIDINLNEVHKL